MPERRNGRVRFQAVDAQELFETIENLFSRVEMEEKPLLSPSAGREIFDRGKMLDRLGGDTELLVEVVDLFIEDYPRLLSQIREAIAQGNAKTLHKAAHALKGSVSIFAAEAASRAAFRLESMGSIGDLSRAREALLDLEGEIDLVVRELVSLAQEVEQ